MEDRNKRFAMLYKETLPNFIERPHVVVGCGAIGGPIIKTLGQIGIKKIHLWDHDNIESVNIGPQGFPENSMHMLKVNIRAEEFSRLSRKSTVYVNDSKFQKRAKHPHNAFWWLCVDSLDAREFIYKTAIESAPEKIIDMRMGGLLYEIYSADLDQETDRYLDSIEWTRNNLIQDSCTSRSTPHTSMTAAAIGINMALTKRPPFAIKGNLMDYSQSVTW